MRKNLFLTSLLTLVAAFGMAQEITKFPITLTTAEGLPGPFVVQNYLFKSDVYTLEAPVKTLRFTVCSTNTVEGLGRNNTDGLSVNRSNGQPFFTVSELRIYDKDGKQINYAGDCNAIHIGDGKGIPGLSDRDELTYLHTSYSERTHSFPCEYHYIEVELEEELSTFSFSIQTRSKYYKNLITYMGITPGTDYLPYPEQEFQLGEKVTTLEEIAEEGALFVMQGNQNTTFNDLVTIEEQEYIHTFPGNLYMRSPYESSITPSAASVFHLIPDLELENTYKLQWLNSGRYIAKHELTGGSGLDEWASWTSSTMEAASIEFAPCDTMAGNFTLSMEGSNDDGVFKSYLGYDAYTRMGLIADVDSAMYKTSRPTSYSWTIYKASIKGAAIKAQLQAGIDEAKERLEAGGGLIEDKDNGEYDALQEVLAKAEAFVADPAVKAADILTTKRELELATAAYAAISVWTYIDSIYTIEELAGKGDIVLSDASDIQPNSYREEAFNAMLDYANTASIIVDRCETLADVDAAIADIYKVIDEFWGAKIPEDPNVVELPFRLGGENDGLPGYNEDNEWIWESPTYTFPEMVNGIRMTVFATVSGRATNGIPFVCINEMEFYDLQGNKIPMTASNFSTPSVVTNEGKGLAGLCDGAHGTDKGVHFHSQWTADSDYDFSEYFYLDITFPTAIGGFKYKQWGRGNGAYADCPKDFVFGEKGVQMNPEDLDYLNLEIEEVDPYNAQLGDQVTAAEEITDDGLYVLVGLINCAPEGNGEGVNNFYRSNKAFGQKFAEDCAFTITKTGDEDGTFYIQSLADGRYLAETIDEDGWGGSTVTYNKAEAGKFHIESHAPIREQYGKEPFDNTFVIYMYNDTVMRQNNAIDSTQKVPHPYIVFQDYAGNSGYFSCHTLEYNDWDGEGEWYIYKMTMDNPYQFWLQNIYDAAQNTVTGFKVSNDPGFYSEESAKPFTEAFVKAQAALDAKSEEEAKAAISVVEATLASAANFELNPMVPGYYIIETGDLRFATKKAMCSYFNNYEYQIIDGDTVYSAPGDYSLWWATAPEDYKEAHDRFKFEFIAVDSTNAKIQEWLANGVITAEDAANAYFIRSVEVDMYVGIPYGKPYSLTDFDKQNNDSAAVAYWLANNAIIPDLGTDVGFTAEPEWPYIVKSNGSEYWFCLWSPIGPKHCFHMQDHNNGGGEAGDILHWNNMVCAVGNATEPSRWTLRTIEDPNTVSIDNLVTDEAEGEVISESYYTVGGAAVPAPVKGINIVKKVYANGVVKSEKILVK